MKTTTTYYSIRGTGCGTIWMPAVECEFEVNMDFVRDKKPSAVNPWLKQCDTLGEAIAEAAYTGDVQGQQLELDPASVLVVHRAAMGRKYARSFPLSIFASAQPFLRDAA